ncbi:aspartate/glutamate racemase family protein [Enterococcus devriesei]|uniref:aspartate/glutamate racemase family protein n=1 Tax=Enterococcus devriesei TaxID=319970 RepID=UPI0036D3BCBD
MVKIAVMAGTPVDTKMGAALIQDLPCELIELAISKNPVQQTYFQTLPTAEKMRQIEKRIQQLVREKVDLLLVYCNSLSASIDFDYFAKHYALTIVTPFQMYAAFAEKYGRIGVLAANGQGAAGIESVLVQHHAGIQVYNVTNLDWVQAVEAKIAPSIIVDQFGLTDSMSFFRKNRVEAILIGCTHFPYFLAEYQSRTAIPCLNPDEALIATIKSILFDTEVF